MSLRPCVHDGRQRPADITCSERCEHFPTCMPPRSAEVKEEIVSTLQAGAVERKTIETLLAALEELQDDSPGGDL